MPLQGIQVLDAAPKCWCLLFGNQQVSTQPLWPVVHPSLVPGGAGRLTWGWRGPMRLLWRSPGWTSTARKPPIFKCDNNNQCSVCPGNFYYHWDSKACAHMGQIKYIKTLWSIDIFGKAWLSRILYCSCKYECKENESCHKLKIHWLTV